MSQKLTAIPNATRAAALFAVTTGLLFLLTPHVGGVSDGLRYQQIATHPWTNAVGTPWAQRVGLPLVARALPFSLKTSFYLLALLAVYSTALLVRAIVHRLGLPERHALAGGVISTWTAVSVTCFWTYYLDIYVVLLVATTVYLTLCGRRSLLIVLIGGGAAIKEVAVLIGPLIALIGGRRLFLTSAAATAAAATVYILLIALLPLHALTPQGSVIHAQLQNARGWLDALRKIGIVKYSANAMLSTFGLTWLLWPIGFTRAPQWARNALWWVPLTLPLFMTTQWERTFAFYTPILVPLALLALPRLRVSLLIPFTLANAWIAGGVQTITIRDDAVTAGTHKLLLMSPGIALAAAVLATAWFLDRSARRTDSRASS